MAVFVPTLLWADLTNAYIWIADARDGWPFGAIGFVDDYLKVKRHTSLRAVRALQARRADRRRHRAWAWRCIVLASQDPAALQHAAHHVSVLQGLHSRSRLVLSGVRGPGARVLMTNAVNLTDGLDGLAISTFAVSAATFTALAYVTGHRQFADYLLLVHFGSTGELTIFCGALVGASLGFLWWNAHPAEVFMGDVGSLALGGALGTVAILIKQELLLPIVGGVFVMEALRSSSRSPRSS